MLTSLISLFSVLLVHTLFEKTETSHIKTSFYVPVINFLSSQYKDFALVLSEASCEPVRLCGIKNYPEHFFFILHVQIIWLFFSDILLLLHQWTVLYIAPNCDYMLHKIVCIVIYAHYWVRPRLW
jgi:hypothetical protein